MLLKRRVAQWRAAVEWMSVCASSEKVGDSFPLSLISCLNFQNSSTAPQSMMAEAEERPRPPCPLRR